MSKEAAKTGARRQGNARESILEAAETLFAANGFNSVSIRDIARAAGAHPGSITYHFGSKAGLLREIYRRHCGPMNARRFDLLAAARRIHDPVECVEAVVRAFVVPAFSSLADQLGGGARFTRLRAVLSAEGNPDAQQIIAETFDDMSHALIDALHEAVPHLTRAEVTWRSHFLLGGLYYTLINPERITRLSRGEADGADVEAAIEEIVAATIGGLLYQPAEHGQNPTD